LKREAMPQLLAAGWALETSPMPQSAVTAADLRELSGRVPHVDLSGVMEAYMDLVFKVRDLGIAFSDRRAVKALKLLAASALLCGRENVIPADLWVFRYVWDREEQIEPLAALVNGVLERQEDQADRHPLSSAHTQPDGEDLARQVAEIETEIKAGKLSLTAIARLRDRLADLGDRAAWLGDAAAKNHLLGQVRKCVERLG
jgi:MoxR-like ATPase